MPFGRCRPRHPAPIAAGAALALVLSVVPGAGQQVAGESPAPAQVIRHRLVLCLAPTITAQPGDATVVYPATARLAVEAEGTPPLLYRWYRGEPGDASTPVGGDASSFTTPVLEAATSYWVRVENSCGHADSAAATVAVTGVPAPEVTVYLGPGATVPLTLLRIRGRVTFLMGSAPTEFYDERDKPQHAVALPRDYYIGKYEVTQAQWRAVTGTNPSYRRDCDECAVEMVSWDDIAGPGGFIETLNRQLGTTGFRLPNEAEWEYAARAGTTTEFSFPVPVAWDTGCVNHIDPPASPFPAAEPYMWWCGNTNVTHPVGTKLPNPWGLYDMHGNIWEWVADWSHHTYDGAPTDGSAWLDPPGRSRVLRGGSWFHGRAHACRSDDRYANYPYMRVRFYGFRLAMDP